MIATGTCPDTRDEGLKWPLIGYLDIIDFRVIFNLAGPKAGGQ